MEGLVSASGPIAILIIAAGAGQRLAESGDGLAEPEALVRRHRDREAADVVIAELAIGPFLL
jgi:hypothetical protein